jgi:diaminopropionate ammonia-lyase
VSKAFQLVRNGRARSDWPADALPQAGFDTAWTEITSWPGYAPTPLVSLPSLARQAGIASLHYKDEAPRFGLGSFKALGGAYAVQRVVARASEPPEAITVATATDGNHGRAVAWGARRLGCNSVIYIHEHVSEGRADAIAAYGAQVRRVPGNYDDSVRQAAADAETNGWHVVSDTSWPGYVETPRDVMFGYGVMAREAAGQMGAAAPPTHLFLQAGVGALAAAVAAWFRHAYGAAAPHIIVAEPDHAPCVYASIAAGHRVDIPGALDTAMAGLAAGEVSELAWSVLEDATLAAMTVSDEAAFNLMCRLAAPAPGEPAIVAGESAVAGLAALMAAAADPAARAQLGLDAASRVLVFGTEGATDPALYEDIVGHAPGALGESRSPAKVPV